MQADPHAPSISADHPLPASNSQPDQQFSEQPGRSKGVRVVVWLVILLIFAVAFYVVLHQKQQKPAAGPRGGPGGGGPVTVTTVTAQRGDQGVYLDAIGTVTPVYTASITSQANGIVTAVHYKEGQVVGKGASLIDIDSRTYRATLMQAQGILDRDQGVLAQAGMDLDRYRAAWARNAISKQVLDDQEKLVQQDQGTVKNDQGTVQYDQIQLSYCHIVAPITGRVGLRLVDPGNVVQANGSAILAVITQVQPITVIFTIPEDSLAQVQPRLRQRAKLSVDAFDRTNQKHLAAGTLLTLDNQIDTTTGTVRARAIFANKDSSLFPNQFVNARLLVDTLHDATLIPSSAIQHNGQAAFVYVLQDNVAHQRAVTPGVTDGNTAEVTGIHPGDVLANSSFDKLQDNAKVSVSTRPVPANTSGSNAP